MITMQYDPEAKEIFDKCLLTYRNRLRETSQFLIDRFDAEDFRPKGHEEHYVALDMEVGLLLSIVEMIRGRFVVGFKPPKVTPTLKNILDGTSPVSCGAISNAFRRIAQAGNFRTRLVVFDDYASSGVKSSGHAACEVLVNNKWVYVDTFYGFCARNSAGNFMSVLDLKANPEISELWDRCYSAAGMTTAMRVTGYLRHLCTVIEDACLIT